MEGEWTGREGWESGLNEGGGGGEGWTGWREEEETVDKRGKRMNWERELAG